MARLIIKATAELPQRTIELKAGVNSFGRTSNNDHMFPFPEISQRHCEILVEKEFVFVRDMESANGTYINGELIRESALYAGQSLQIGALEMVLETEEIRISLPDLPKPEPNRPAPVEALKDGYAACQNHPVRHAVWECPHCAMFHCDECIRKLRRIGGVHLKLCPVCSNPCNLSEWSEMMRKKKKGFFGSLVGKITSGLKRSTTRLTHPEPPRKS